MQGGTKVYVGNLTEAVTTKDLEREFQRFGKLTEVWVAHNPSGFGFVHFREAKDAAKAVRTLDGKNVQGVRLKVEMSHNDKGPGGRGGTQRRNSGRRRESGRARGAARPPARPAAGPRTDRPRKPDRRKSPSPQRKRLPRSPHSPGRPRRKASFSSASSMTPSPPPARRPLSPPLPARRGSPGGRGGRDYLPLPPPLPPLPDYPRDRYADERRYRSSNGAAGWDRARSPPLPPPLPLPRYRSRSPVARHRYPHG